MKYPTKIIGFGLAALVAITSYVAGMSGSINSTVLLTQDVPVAHDYIWGPQATAF